MTALPESKRAEMVLFYEGRAITTAGEHDIELGADCARCMVDGAMNALLRLDGAEKASLYAYAVADRIVARVKEPTRFVVPKPTIEAEIAAVVAEQRPSAPQKASPKPMRFWAIFAAGYLCGAFTGLLAK